MPIPTVTSTGMVLPTKAAMAHERQSALDQRAAVRVVLVDFKKAFDSVNYNILLNTGSYLQCV